MSDNEAAERLRHWISEEVDPTAPLKDAYTLLDAALARERSAGAAPDYVWVGDHGGGNVDVQADDLLEACYERNIHSRGDMERSAGAAPLDVETLASVLDSLDAHWLDDMLHGASGWNAAKVIAAEYSRLSEGTDR